MCATTVLVVGIGSLRWYARLHPKSEDAWSNFYTKDRRIEYVPGGAIFHGTDSSTYIESVQPETPAITNADPGPVRIIESSNVYVHHVGSGHYPAMVRVDAIPIATNTTIPPHHSQPYWSCEIITDGQGNFRWHDTNSPVVGDMMQATFGGKFSSYEAAAAATWKYAETVNAADKLRKEIEAVKTDTKNWRVAK